MIESNLADEVFNIRVAIKQQENALPANTVLKLKVEEANTANPSLTSNTFSIPFSSNASANDLILDTRSFNYIVTNTNVRFIKVSLEVSNNYSNAVFDNKIRFWNFSITKDWGLISNAVTTVPVFPTTVVLPKPLVDFQGFPAPAIKAADNLTITAPTIVNEIGENQLFYIKGISPAYLHRSSKQKTAFSWEGPLYSGSVPSNAIVLIGRAGIGNTAVIEVYSNGVVVGRSSPGPTIGEDGKFSIAFTANTSQLRVSFNGGPVLVNNYNTTATWQNGDLSVMKIGRGRAPNDAGHLNGTIKVFRFERRAVTDEELIALASNTA